MENKKPNLEECYAMIDAAVSQEDKNLIMASTDTIEFHFTLGMWIRNNLIYKYDLEYDDLFINERGLFLNLHHPDDLSTDIIDAYKEYLINKK